VWRFRRKRSVLPKSLHGGRHLLRRTHRISRSIAGGNSSGNGQRLSGQEHSIFLTSHRVDQTLCALKPGPEGWCSSAIGSRPHEPRCAVTTSDQGRSRRGPARRAVARTGGLHVPLFERLHLLFGRAANMTFKFLARRRIHPRVRADWGRAQGRLPADAPLPETSARNLPPADEPREGHSLLSGRVTVPAVSGLRCPH